jgi:hypothetical protein
MILSFVNFSINFALFFFLAFLPLVFLFGLISNTKKEEDIAFTKEEGPVYNPPKVDYEPQAIKVRDGYYVVKSTSNNKEAHIQKMAPEGARVYWVLTLPGNVVEQHWTKKAAVAVAIEKVK